MPIKKHNYYRSYEPMSYENNFYSQHCKKNSYDIEFLKSISECLSNHDIAFGLLAIAISIYMSRKK